MTTSNPHNPPTPDTRLAGLRAELADTNTAIRAARQAFEPDQWKRLVAHAGELSVQIAALTTRLADLDNEMETTR